MPSAFRDPKTLPEWIELDYYRRPRGLRRWRRWITWGALLLSAGVLAAVTVLPRGPRIYEAGPVSPAHAMYNNDCAKCHTEAFQTAKRFWPGNAALHAVPDSACIQCHDGPPHNPRVKEGEVQACATCHREHRGRTVLARLADDGCVSCHADIKAHTTAPEKCKVRDVMSFPGRHPEFALWAKPSDPGKLKFNHAKHLVEQGVLMPGTEKRRKLECVNCHQTESDGRYMQPIRYEQHCQECHPLSVRLTGEFEGKLEKAVEKFQSTPVPHRTPEIVRAVLRDRLVELVRHVHPGPAKAAAEELPRGLPLPESGEMASRIRWQEVHGQPITAAQRKFVNLQLQHAEEMLFDRPGACLQCHELTKPAGGGELPKVVSPEVPKRWMFEARFSHRKHRGEDCILCHEGVKESQTASDVLMPKKQVCAECHNPAKGVRSDCVECHQYHDRCEDRGAGRKQNPPNDEACKRRRNLLSGGR